MNRNILITVAKVCCSLILLLTSFSIHSQCLTAFRDTRDTREDYFYIYDNGELRQQEYQKIQSFQIGRNFVAYVDFTSALKIYKDGFTFKLQDFPPVNYYVTDYLLIIENTGDYLYAFDGSRVYNIGRLDPEIPHYAFGDSVMAFNDYLHTFYLFYNGQIIPFDNRRIEQFGARENIIAFVDPDYEYKILYHGEIITLETGSPPQSFKVHTNIAAYVDFIGDFKVFLRGQTVRLTTIAPLQYEVGENMVAYLTDTERKFMVYYEGKNYELLPIPPKSFEVKDNVLVFIDNYNHFHVFYKGKTEKLATYTPESYQIDRDIVVFTDLDKRLIGYIDGRRQNVSNEIVSDYSLKNKAVLFSKVRSSMKVACGGEINQLY